MLRFLIPSFVVLWLSLGTVDSALVQTPTHTGLAPGQVSASAGSGPRQAPGGLVPPLRPMFGDRPVGQGFRPATSAGRPGLLRAGGLQDAMQAARSSPLYPGFDAGTVAPNADPELTQALQTLRSLHDVRGKQIATQGSRQRRSVPVLTRVVTANLPAPTPTNLATIQQHVFTSLQNVGQLPDELTVRQDGRAIVLEGVVESEARRGVVEQLIRLEPGVYEVENRLRVEPPK